MERIISKIDKILDDMEVSEKKRILEYYQEIISDRLENNESIEAIENSIDYNEIKREYFNNSVLKYEKKAIKKNTLLTLKLLAYLFASPILIPLAIIYLLVIFIMYLLGFSGAILLVTFPVGIFSFILEQVSNNIEISTILITLGILIIAYALLAMILVIIVKGISNINLALVKGVVKIISKKGKKQDESIL